jgi:hypothetical protein
MRFRLLVLGALSALALLLLPALATGHAERATHYPDPTQGERPNIRSAGKAHIVCKPDSRKRIKRSWKGRSAVARRHRKRLAKLYKRCKYRHIQAAVNKAKTGHRILILPGVYREEPSRRVPLKDPKCAGDEYWEASGDNHQEDGRVPTYKHQVDCPNSRNLIAVIGDSLNDPDRRCDQKCNLQMQGLGRLPRHVKIENDRIKQDVIRADRADGFILHNVLVEQGGYNNIDLVETNGFKLTKLVSRWAKNYGILTFTSDHGLYADINAYGSGDSGIYPGSGPEGHCARYGVEVTRVNSHGNGIGSSGTAGNGTWYHDNKLHHNGAGSALDSFAPGHPGMPQDCSKWIDNEIYSNNKNLFDDQNEAYCNSTPFEKRRKEVVCPQFVTVVGTGLMFYGANRNVIQRNKIYDNWRSGIRLFWVPAAARGENDPTKQYDTSNANSIIDNQFGVGPNGALPNGQDVTWDEQGVGNCWERNQTAPGKRLTSDPPTLPTCSSGGSNNPTGNPLKTAAEAPCTQWHPRDNPDPPGCSWFTTPPRPER